MAFTKIVGAGIQTTTDVTVGNVQAGIITATTFSGSFTGAVTGTATSTTNIPNLTGAITSSNTTTSLGSFSSSDLATALTDETGSGAAVFATSPTLSTVTVSSGGINVTGVSTFSGGIQGNVTGNVNSSGVSTFSSVNVTGNVSIGGTLTYDDVTNVDSIGLVTARSGVRIDAGGLVVTAGVSTFTTGPVIIGAATSTGTASQPLQVTGGAYVSGNIGVGTTNPTAKLQVVGSTDLNKLNLSGISSSISSTAVDVFVYDTRKDSDGGAWRKRTQHTSWYNETLNTATRGSRRDFPAVAVIVIESLKVTIYDGDDPDLPMWMVIYAQETNGSTTAFSNYIDTYNYSQFWVSALTSLSAVNGVLFVANSNYVSNIFYFISDKIDLCTGSFGSFPAGFATYSLPISGRNSPGKFTRYSSIGPVSSSHNDVAMTVLPNAPIDPSTGLPVPTIAVATDYGVSVIKDDGSVVDHIDSAGGLSTQVAFTQDGKLAHSHDGHTGIRIDSLKSSDFTYGTNKVARWNSEEFYINYGIISSGWSGNTPKLNTGSFNIGGQIVPIQDNILAERANTGLNLLARDFPSSPNNNRVAYATTSYNTGWMHGDIKGAFLSDTSTASVTGTELVTNGTFAGNLNGWTLAGEVTPTYDSGSGGAKITTAVGVDGNISQTISSTAGVVVTFSITARTSGYVGLVLNGTLVLDGLTALQSYTYYSDSTITSIALVHRGGGGGYAIVDNVSVRRTEKDRSVNNKGLQVFGTITKTPVASGANLVGYGFNGSNSNYLLQPYNSDLDFGTGDFSVMYWYYQNTSPTTYQDVVSRTTSPLSDGNWTIQHFPNDSVYMYHRVSGSWNTLGISGSDITHNGWNFIAVTRSSSICRMYFDGVQVDSRINAYTMTNTSAQLKISTRVDNTSYPLESGNSVALVHISASAPSPEQIKKIYEDEKMLFQENSQATLYGASDAVTALAYDDTTNLLSVGTSSGRSDFQGLRRINNTTTAVTTAISASNGLIAEQ
jgi:trimeric autotransporter adhesin